MMDTDERAEVEAERQEREQAHRKWVRETFARGRVPEGMDPWEVGVVVIYTRGSARDYGRIHRASCRHVRNTVNASWSTRSSIYTYDTFWDRPGYSGQPSTCKTCGTDDLSQLLKGGNYFGEPQESIDRRRETVATRTSSARCAATPSTPSPRGTARQRGCCWSATRPSTIRSWPSAPASPTRTTSPSTPTCPGEPSIVARGPLPGPRTLG
jgi:hypothetical protein